MRGSRSIWAGVVASLALTLLLASVAYAAPIKKLYTANIVAVHPPVTAGLSEDFTLELANKAATQQLGSCNVTIHAALTGLSSSQGTFVGNVWQLRNLAIAALGSASIPFSATAPAQGDFTSTIECRHANNFSPDQPSNKYTLDTANSNLTITAEAASVPSRDVQVAFGGVVGSTTYPPDTPDPGTTSNAGATNRVLYTITVTNNSATLSVTGVSLGSVLTAPAGTSFSEIPAQGLGSGAGWTCPGAAGSTQASCQLTGSLGPSASTVIQAWVQTSTTPGSIQNAVNVSAAEPDDDTANNSASETTTVNEPDPGNCDGNPSCVTSFIITCAEGGNTVSSGATTNASRWLVGTAIMPQTDSCDGLPYSMHAVKTADISNSCPVDNVLVKCDFEFFMQDVPAGFDADHPITLVLVCNNDADHCAVTLLGTFVLVKRNATTGEITRIPRCGSIGAGSLCYDVSVDAGGNITFTVNGLTFGDPYVAGKCIPPHTCGPGS